MVMPDLERIIAEVLARRRAGCVRVVITGEDERALPDTLTALEALYQAGYELQITLSHSAGGSAVRPALLSWCNNFTPPLTMDTRAPQPEEAYSELFFPALSGNSLAKIALCLRDNIASQWAFHALQSRKKIVATLNNEIANGDFPPAVRQQQRRYIATLREYGVIVPDNAAAEKRLLSLADIQRHPQTMPLRIAADALITPAARDEITRRRIRLIKEE